MTMATTMIMTIKHDVNNNQPSLVKHWRSMQNPLQKGNNNDENDGQQDGNP